MLAGTTALFTYQVDVTPTSAGQRIPVTGTPASNGTRAQYVDETGNTTQARATYLFGPLCELAMTQGLLTEAVISGFRASRADGGGVLLEVEDGLGGGDGGLLRPALGWRGAPLAAGQPRAARRAAPRAAGGRLPLRRPGSFSS